MAATRVTNGLTLGAGLVVVALAAAATGLSVEGHDATCAACHLPPEATPVARARTEPPEDLASAHAQASPAPVRCIDCHGGVGPAARVAGLGLAARDAAAFATGRYVVVGGEYTPLGRSAHPKGDAPCLACHGDVPQEEGFARHYHNLLTDSRAPELPCAACHLAHAPAPDTPGHVVRAAVAAGCDTCHTAMGGPYPVLEIGSTGSRAGP